MQLQISVGVSISETSRDQKTDFQEPTYPGGIEQFQSFVQANIEYSKKSQKKLRGQRGNGTVFIVAKIDDAGNVTAANTLKGMHPELDEAAQGVTLKSPSWNPAKQDSKPTSSGIILVYNFTIQ